MRWISIAVSLTFLLLIVGWMATGNVGSEAVRQAAAEREASEAAQSQVSVEPFLVKSRLSQATPYTRRITINGRTQGARHSEIKAEIAARVVRLGVREGDLVEGNALIVDLSVNTRQSAVIAAQSSVERSRKNYDAVRDLSNSGFQSELELLSAKEALAVAEQNLVKAQQELSDVKIYSPYQGIIQKLHIEQGDLVSPGQTVATIIDLDPLEVVTFVSEQELAQIVIGQNVMVRLTNGENFEGKVSYISPSSDISTGTFEVRIAMPNAGMRLAEGLSGIVSIEVETVMSHFQSKNILTLNDKGFVGVKALGENNIVEFYPVEILDDTQDGVHLAGLPDTLSLIYQGHDYVVAGATVRVE